MQLDINGTHIHVTQRGKGTPALVFLHYYGGSSRTWESVINVLTHDYHSIAYDHRGWGESGKPEDGYDIAGLAADTESVIKALGLQRYILVGHSMGGKVAQLFASRQPQGLEGLILVAPSPPVPMHLSDEERKVLKSAYSSRESVEYVIDHVLTAKTLSAVHRKQVVEDSLKGSIHAKKAWPDEAMREDITAWVTAINVPTLVVSGDQDKVERLNVLKEELLPRIPEATLKVIPGAGHLLPLEVPEILASLIAGFAAGVVKQPG
ncbi:hydrolase [Mangrovibacter sp. MFB070]|uniref:alpha/beta fold hydrolase n=1 Tax=Mangrovibacter sp. MFB070 TaxID=1224318 RepID=UPI0004D3DBD2|nr:alpha/beta hydrolase [Mangrovibacter sp. MFB070]KEA52988.1 hydrolase [Mangrovibacter sp. MFB070]